MRLGVPLISQRLFFGDLRAAADYESALARLARMGFSFAEVDIEPLSEAAQLLYDGPWLAERYLVARKLLEENPKRATSNNARGHRAGRQHQGHR